MIILCVWTIISSEFFLSLFHSFLMLDIRCQVWAECMSSRTCVLIREYCWSLLVVTLKSFFHRSSNFPYFHQKIYIFKP